MPSKKTDIFVLMLLPIIASAIVLHTNTNLLLISVLLFFGLPSLYLALREPRILKKSLLFTLAFAIPATIFADTIATLNGSWVIPVTLFPAKLFGISTVENYLFGFFWVLFAILFYEYFFDKAIKNTAISARFRYIFYAFTTSALITIVISSINKNLLLIPYFYAIIGTVFILIPLLLFLYRYPKYIFRFIALGLYFFFLLTIFEVTALITHQWLFTSPYFIGFVQFAGYRFPVEELLFWLILATPALLAYYEFFADHTKLTAKKF